MRSVQKVKRQWETIEKTQEEDKTQKQPKSKENAGNANPTDWAAVWHQLHGSPTQRTQRLIVRDDDEGVISKQSNEKEPEGTP